MLWYAITAAWDEAMRRVVMRSSLMIMMMMMWWWCEWCNAIACIHLRVIMISVSAVLQQQHCVQSWWHKTTRSLDHTHTHTHTHRPILESDNWHSCHTRLHELAGIDQPYISTGNMSQNCRRHNRVRQNVIPFQFCLKFSKGSFTICRTYEGILRCHVSCS